MCDVLGLLATRISSIARIYPDQREHPEAVYTILGGCFPKLFYRKTWIRAPGMFPPATCGTTPGRVIRKWDMSFRPVLMLTVLWYIEKTLYVTTGTWNQNPKMEKQLDCPLEFSFSYEATLGDPGSLPTFVFWCPRLACLLWTNTLAGTNICCREDEFLSEECNPTISFLVCRTSFKKTFTEVTGVLVSLASIARLENLQKLTWYRWEIIPLVAEKLGFRGVRVNPYRQYQSCYNPHFTPVCLWRRQMALQRQAQEVWSGWHEVTRNNVNGPSWNHGPRKSKQMSVCTTKNFPNNEIYWKRVRHSVIPAILISNSSIEFPQVPAPHRSKESCSACSRRRTDSVWRLIEAGVACDTVV